MKQKDPNYIYSKRLFYADRETLLPCVVMNFDQEGRLYRTFSLVLGFIPQMGMFVNFHEVDLDHIDVHSTFALSVSYPAPWLSRKEINIKSMMRAK
jgi:hypothetical protein